MRYRSDHRVRWLTALLITSLSLSCLSCHREKSSDFEKDRIRETAQRAVSWVYKHPASFIDGTFIEISEEIITFYLLRNYENDPAQKAEYVKEIQKRMELIASQKDFQVKPQEYTMFLAVTDIGEKLGMDTMNFRKVIQGKITSDPLTYPPHMTTNIWNTVYLERLGYNPPKDIEKLMPLSTISKELNQRLLVQYTVAQYDASYIDPISITIYDLTHEIFSLTDFGKLPPPPLIAENWTFFADLFNQTIEWAITAEHVDILAELIMCAKLCDLTNIPSLDRGIGYIISRQEKDGSFGITNPGRENIYRHGILVSIMALSMFSEENNGVKAKN